MHTYPTLRTTTFLVYSQQAHHRHELLIFNFTTPFPALRRLFVLIVSTCSMASAVSAAKNAPRRVSDPQNHSYSVYI